MIAQLWPESFWKKIGGTWPRSYVAFDLETTGFSFHGDLILEYGHVLVEDGNVTDKLSVIIDWTRHPQVPEHWLRGKLNTVRNNLYARGLPYHIDYDRLQKDGVAPDTAFRFIIDFLKEAKSNGYLFAAHNGYNFDEKMLSANLGTFADVKDFSFGDNGLIDTDSIEKANQLAGDPRMLPRLNDTMRSYCARIKSWRMAGVKSNLADHCYRKYGFEAKGIDRKTMHGAMVDAQCVALLMEEFYRQLREPVAPTPILIGSAVPQPQAAVMRRRGQRNR